MQPQLKIYRDADAKPDAPGGDPAPAPAADPKAPADPKADPKTADPKPASLDLSSKVTLADGTEVTVADLAASHAKVKASGEAAAASDQVLEAYDVLLDADSSPDEWEDSARVVLTAKGYDEDAIDTYIEEYRPVAEGDDKPKKTAADDKRLSKLEKRQDRADAAATDATRRELADLFDKKVGAALDSHKDLTVLFDKVGTRDGKDAAAKLKKASRERIAEAVKSRIRTRYAETDTFDRAWIAEEAKKAVKGEAEYLQSVIGDLSKVGRAPETVAGDESGFALPDEPVAFPAVPKTRKERKEAFADLTKASIDSLLRGAQQADTEAATKA